jgi:hypothetical protein
MMIRELALAEPSATSQRVLAALRLRSRLVPPARVAQLLSFGVSRQVLLLS